MHAPWLCRIAGTCTRAVLEMCNGLNEDSEMTLSADLAIRMRRAAFNRALADADLRVIGPLLAPNAVLVAGTDSALISGRKAQLQAWKQEFASATRTIYTRTAETIAVSPILPVALEYGRWDAVDAETDVSTASGTYVAKWRETNDGWVIEAEIFITLT